MNIPWSLFWSSSYEAKTKRHAYLTTDKTDAETARTLLSARYSTTALHWLTQLSVITRQVDLDLQQQFGVSLGEYGVLAILEHGPMAQKTLYQHIHRSEATVSRWLVRLDRKGWLVRRRPAHDRRELTVSITRKGRNQLRRFRRHWDTALEPLAEGLSRKEKHLLRRLEQNLSCFLSLRPTPIRRDGMK